MTLLGNRPATPVRPGPVEALHHGSHRRLLTAVRRPAAPKPCDAIIVPSSRPIGSLDYVVGLAREAGCALLVLCSGRSRAGDVAALGGRGLPVTAIDVNGLRGVLPALETTALHRGTGLPQPGDIGRKRNLGLVVARAAGWKRVLFLDDDIEVPRPADLGEVAAVVDGFYAVGLDNAGFHDNSVVCHALRHIGARQDAFIGGGAMMVRPAATESFFPEIYNEDWLFLLRNTSLGAVASHGTMIQQTFDPFDDPARAASQEFGDVLAEGIYWLLDGGVRIRPAEESSWADVSYWREAVRRRHALINHIMLRLVGAPGPARLRSRILASLTAAIDAHRSITADLCVDYMQAWHRDRATWRQFVRGVRSPDGPRSAEAACRDLGIRVNYDLRPADPRAARLSHLAGSSTVDGCPASSDPLKTEISPPSFDGSGRRSFSDSALISSAAGTASS